MCWNSCWWSALVPDAVQPQPETGSRFAKLASHDGFLHREVPLACSGPSPDDLADPARLPDCGDPERWPMLQRLRRSAGWPLDPWLLAIESGAVAVDPALLSVLAERLDGTASLRLLRWWWLQPHRDPHWPGQIGRVRDPLIAAWLRDQLTAPAGGGPDAAAAPLLPLLGFQRQIQDGALLARWAMAPLPVAVRRAALEGLAVGLGAWPQARLRGWLRRLAADLDPALAATAVDLLARLPRARQDLVALAAGDLDPAVEQRRQRRLAALPVSALLLVVHGRTDGVVPPELQELAAALARRRGAPVVLEALTAEPPAAPLHPGAGPRTLVPLLLLPGGHVCHDIPAIAARWRLQGPVRRLPFLGAWPAWQQALRQELQAMAAAAGALTQRPLLLHHPLSSPLAMRYLAWLEQVTGAKALATPYSAADANDPPLTPNVPALPLALAANRLTDRLGDRIGPPLLQRPALRTLLLDALEALP
jgi:sirohydrochlorin ferrochelatase